MNYKYIENIVLKSRNSHELSKEKLEALPKVLRHLPYLIII